MKRSEILTTDNIRELSGRVRFLELFQKITWPEYLAILAQIYDAIEERGEKIPYSDAVDLIERFYFDRNLQWQDNKNFSVITMLVNELGVLREAFEAGDRFVDTTRDGKQLLHWVQELNHNRPQFTGTGAETLVSTLQQLILDPKELSVEEAVERHRGEIRKLQADIERIKDHGVQASELLNPGVSGEELYQRADEEASRILLASEDVKIAIESARKELTQRYLDTSFSAGDAIEFVADYHESLRKKPEYQSYARAKEILSHIEGLGSLSAGRGMRDLITELESKRLVARHLLQRGALHRFPEQFEATIRGIEEKLREQLYLLKVQVQYVLGGNSRQTRDELMALHAILMKRKQKAVDYLEEHPLVTADAPPFELGVLEADRLERLVDPELPGVSENGLGTQGSDQAIVAMLRQSEEATVDRILKRLQGELDRTGEAILSDYPLLFGLAEYYVLARIECFSRSIRATEVGQADIRFKSGFGGEVALVGVANYRYELT